MPTTIAKGGFGTKLYMNVGGSWTAVSEVGDYNGPKVTLVMEDATNHDSPNGWAEKIPVGVKEPGDLTFQCHLIEGDGSQNQLQADIRSGVKRDFRLVYPSGTRRLSFSGYVQDVDESRPVKGKMTHSVVISPTGEIVREAHP